MSPCLRGEKVHGLFQPMPSADSSSDRTRPLADRMRPRTLDEFVGQEHLVAPGKPLRTQIERDDTRLAHLLGTAGHRQNHAGADHRPHDQSGVHRVLRRAHRHQGNQASHGRRRTRPPIRHAHHRLHRRDPPLQQSAAGRLSAARREGQHPPDRRDHRESVVRNHLRAALAQPRLCAQAADRGANRAAAQARA